MPTTSDPKIPFTQAAYEEMQQKYQQLQTERKAVMIRLQTAREMGDLSENGAYHYAKFELGSIGRQLRQLKHLLENGEVVKASTQTDVAEFGKTVSLKLGSKTTTYLLVSMHESNPAQGKLSVESPLGKAIVGKKVGEEIVFQAPAGEVKYQLTNIS